MTKERSKKQRSRLATQIRISYIVLLLPSLVFIAYAFYNMWSINKRNNDMISSVVTASEFSSQFKEDFDNATYLLIVGYVTPEDSGLKEELAQARAVVDQLKGYTNTEDNQQRLLYEAPPTVHQ